MGEVSARRERRLSSVLDALVGEEGLPANVRGQNAPRPVQRALAAGGFLFQPGTEADQVYVVLEGRLRIFSVSDSGKEVVFWHSHMGDLLGVSELYGGSRRFSFAQAKEPTKVLVLSSRWIEDRIASHPVASQVLLEHLGERLCRARSSILAIAGASVASRLAHLLMVLSEDVPARADGTRVLDAHYSQQELADMIGATRQSVSEAVGELKARGMITPVGGSLVVAPALYA